MAITKRDAMRIVLSMVLCLPLSLLVNSANAACWTNANGNQVCDTTSPAQRVTSFVSQPIANAVASNVVSRVFSRPESTAYQTTQSTAYQPTSYQSPSYQSVSYQPAVQTVRKAVGAGRRVASRGSGGLLSRILSGRQARVQSRVASRSVSQASTQHSQAFEYQPSYGQPSYSQPRYSQPNYSQPSYEQIEYSQPTYTAGYSTDFRPSEPRYITSSQSSYQSGYAATCPVCGKPKPTRYGVATSSSNGSYGGTVAAVSSGSHGGYQESTVPAVTSKATTVESNAKAETTAPPFVPAFEMPASKRAATVNAPAAEQPDSSSAVVPDLTAMVPVRHVATVPQQSACVPKTLVAYVPKTSTISPRQLVAAR